MTSENKFVTCHGIGSLEFDLKSHTDLYIGVLVIMPPY